MSTVDIEAFDAREVSVTVQKAKAFNREVEPDDPFDKGHAVLVLDGDPCAVLYGPPAVVRDELVRALAQLDALYPDVAAAADPWAPILVLDTRDRTVLTEELDVATRHNRPVRVTWDDGLKVKVGHGGWTPPLGRPEAGDAAAGA